MKKLKVDVTENIGSGSIYSPLPTEVPVEKSFYRADGTERSSTKKKKAAIMQLGMELTAMVNNAMQKAITGSSDW